MKQKIVMCLLMLFSMQAFSQTIPAYMYRSYGICLALTQYLNKEDASTMKYRDFNSKHQPRMQKIYQTLQSCMKGKQDTAQQVDICAQSTLSKEDYDFYRGYLIGLSGIRASEPNMNEIRSKFRTGCSDIVN